MSFSVGIVGLPNVGKSTLFKALTKKPVDIAPYPFTTINPNVGIVTVPDKRLEEVAKIIKPEKVVPTIIEFVDIAGLVRGAHKGEGLGNQFLSHVRNCDAILEVVRSFEDEKVEHVDKSVNPERDIETIKNELLMKDLETLEGVLVKLEKESKSNDKETLKKLALFRKLKEELSQGKDIRDIELNEEELQMISEFQFLTAKPVIYVLNIGNQAQKSFGKQQKILVEMNLKMEEEISELSEEDKEELTLTSQLDQIIIACYNILDLVTFYTVAGGKETRAWTIKKGTKCPRAGGKVHSDFEEKFIRAEVIEWNKLVEASSWAKAREKGWIQIVGKDYIVRDGDVIEFKI
jgi:hypothetical protein